MKFSILSNTSFTFPHLKFVEPLISAMRSQSSRDPRFHKAKLIRDVPPKPTYCAVDQSNTSPFTQTTERKRKVTHPSPYYNPLSSHLNLLAQQSDTPNSSHRFGGKWSSDRKVTALLVHWMVKDHCQLLREV